MCSKGRKSDEKDKSGAKRNKGMFYGDEGNGLIFWQETHCGAGTNVAVETPGLGLASMDVPHSGSPLRGSAFNTPTTPLMNRAFTRFFLISLLTAFFHVSAAPVHEVLSSFEKTPWNPVSGAMVLGTDGMWWGTTGSGGAYGYGTVYKVSADGSRFQTVISFNGNNGERLMCGLADDGSGSLWGATNEGGSSDLGTVYKVNVTTGVMTTVFEFDGSSGVRPIGGLVNDGNGYMWGTTSEGGTDYRGTVFKVQISTGTLTTVANISGGAGNTGSRPAAPMTVGSGGFLWGTTEEGGSNGCGTLFKISMASGALTTVINFTGDGTQNKGTRPVTSLILDEGFLWGTTSEGGGPGYGTVFKVSESTGVLTTVVQFAQSGPTNPGSYPKGGLVRSGGFFWGTTIQDGDAGGGTLFKVDVVTGTLTNVFSFPSFTEAPEHGSHPIGTLASDGAGHLWGATEGGASIGAGTVFRVNTATGALETLIDLGLSTGFEPMASLVPDGAGSFWGTTARGGAVDAGTIYKLDPATGFRTKVAEFTGATGGNKGAAPEAMLCPDGAGWLWGVTTGGSKTLGSVFKVNISTGQLATVAEFTGNGNGTHRGAGPRGFLLGGAAGTFWGTTSEGGEHGKGTIFKMDTASGTLTTIADFDDAGLPGYAPYAGLTNDGAGFLWGTTVIGGPGGDSTFFKINLATEAVTHLPLFSEQGGDDKGSYPVAALLHDGADHLWGTTQFGGEHGGYGTVFKVHRTSAALTTVVSFTENGAINKGRAPSAGLTSDGAGNFWGTARDGGTSGHGTVFKVDASTGVLTTVVNFSGTGGQANTGSAPLYGNLLKHSDGNFYGTTSSGGPGGGGTVFRIRRGATPVTLAATNATSTSATLNGTLNPNGAVTAASFEWGTSPTLAGATTVSAGSTTTGTSAEVVSAPLSGLSSGTTYYYRAVGTNADNAVAQKGAIMSFTTTTGASFAFGAATDVGVTASTYTASGPVTLTLNHAPATGASLMVVNNTGLPFITGTFSNLAHGQLITLTYNSVDYQFVANYCGGTGNDLVLQWAKTRPVTWGSNGYGEQGSGSTTGREGFSMVVTSGVLAGKTILSLHSGGNTCAAVCSDGRVATWGSNWQGVLGNNSSASQSLVPVAVTSSGALAGKTVVALSLGHYHVLALCSDGTVVSWGSNSGGALGSNMTGSPWSSNVPVAVYADGVLAGKKVVSVAAGYNSNLALCSDGTLVSWGSNDNGELGNGSPTWSSAPTFNPAPVLVDMSGVLAGKSVVEIMAGGQHFLVRCSDGTLAAWGANQSGQLGNNSTTLSNVPVAVTTSGGLGGKMVTSIAVGGAHNFAACSDGTLVAWGSNSIGQLGDNSTTNRLIPTPWVLTGVLAGKTLSRFSAGAAHSIAFCTDGTIASWGVFFGSAINSTLGSSIIAESSSIPVLSDYIFPLGLMAGGSSTGSGCNVGLAPIPLSSNVTTLPAYNITTTGAGLRAVANPAAGASLSLQFERGLTTAYGSTTNGNFPSVDTPTVVTSSTGAALAPSTTYHYRAKGTSAAGVAFGQDVAFSTVNTNARLSNLAPSAGALSPVFSSGRFAYTVNVPLDTASFSITPTAAGSNATVKVNNEVVPSGSPSSPVSLNVGSNTITVQVTAQDGSTKQSYGVMVFRSATNPVLSALTASVGTLSPTFSPDTLSYDVTVPYTSTFTAVTPVKQNSGDTLKVNSVTVASGSPSGAIPLAIGRTVIPVVVTGQDGVTTRAYQVTVNRTLPTPGELDVGFGTGGVVTGSMGTGNHLVFDIVVQSDGKFIVVGAYDVSLTTSPGGENANWNFAMTRYHPNGTLDTTFGSGGKVLTEFGGTDMAHGAVLQPDGKIVLAGKAEVPGEARFALARYNTNGTLDSGFGMGGKVITSWGLEAAIINDVALQENGRIVVAGYTFSYTARNKFVVARYNANGSLDSGVATDSTPGDGFGIGGMATPSFNGGPYGSGGPHDMATTVAVQSDQKIVVGGYASNGSTLNFALARCLPDGSPDPGFGSAGTVMTPFGGTQEYGRSLIVQDDGKLLLVGEAYFGQSKFGLARYLDNGSLDPDFGTGGLVTTEFFGPDNRPASVALQSNGMILVAGSASRGGGELDFALARYSTAGTLDATFGDEGKVTKDLGSSDWGRKVVVLPDGTLLMGGEFVSGDRTVIGLMRYNAHAGASELHVAGPDGSSLTSGGPLVSVGGAALNSTVTKDFTIQSTGAGPLYGLNVTFDGDNSQDFTVAQQPPAVVPPGGSSVITVRLKPSALGARKAVMHITSNVGDGGAFDIPLTGGVPGSLDLTYGGLGTGALADSVVTGGHMVLQPDGKAVIVGQSYSALSNSNDFVLIRHNRDGSLDTSFAGVGQVMTDFGGTNDVATRVALQANGRILVAGYTMGSGPRKLLMARYNTDGTLDSTFNGTGTLFVNDAGVADIVVQTDQKIVVATGQLISPGNSGFGAYRFNTDGTLDATFEIADFGPSSDYPSGVCLQKDGRIILVGRTEIGGRDDWAAARYLPDGSLDPSFSADGKVTTFLAAHDDVATSATVQPNGKIVVTGWSTESDFSARKTAVVRYHEDGALDTSFNGTGKVIASVETGGDSASSVLVQPDGKIVTAGFSGNGVRMGFSILRLNANGSFDTTFNGTGKVVTGITDDDMAFQVAMQDDGNLLAGGTSMAGGYRLARYIGLAPAPEISVEHDSGSALASNVGSVSFGNLLAGASASQTFVVRNDGIVNLTGLILTKTGSHSGDYTVTSFAGTPLAPGESRAFTVTYSPLAGGTRNALISIASNDADENPFKINLTGTSPSTLPHNNLSGRINLGSAATVDVGGNNTGATSETGETTLGNTAGASVWYEWTAPADDWVTVHTKDSKLNTVVTVFSGTGTNMASLSLMGFNNRSADASDFVAQPTGADPSRITFHAVAGTSYKIAVMGAMVGSTPAKNTFQLHIAPAPTPALRVAGLTLTPDAVDVTASVQDTFMELALEADSEMFVPDTGITGRLWYGDGKGRSIGFTLTAADVVSGDLFAGTFERGFTLPRYVPAGAWVVTVEGSLVPGEVVRWSPTGGDFVEDHFLVPPPVTGAVSVTNNGLTDGAPPVLVGITGLPAVVNVQGGEVTYMLDVTITDALAGFSQGRLRTGIPSTPIITIDSSHLMTGNAQSGIYRVPLTIPQGTPAGVYYPKLNLDDAALNWSSFTDDAANGPANVPPASSAFSFTVSTAPLPFLGVELPDGTRLVDNVGTVEYGGVQVGTQKAITFTLMNTGGTALSNISIFKNGTHASNYTVDGPVPGTSLAPGETTTFIVSLQPGASGVRTAAIHITSNDAATPFDINLRGTGTGADILGEPASQLVELGQPATFEVVASGTGALTYKWLKNGAAIAGATADSHTIPAAALASAGGYAATVTDSVGVTTTRTAQLGVVNVTGGVKVLNEGAALSLVVPAAGTGLTFEWYRNGEPVVNSIRVTGATTANLKIASVGAADPGTYTCVVGLEEVRLETEPVEVGVVLKPVLDVFAPTGWIVSGLVSDVVSAQNDPTKYTVTALPPGVTFDTLTGQFGGRPTSAGAYAMKVSATNAAGTSPVLTVPVTVVALPAGVVGVFNGLVDRDPTHTSTLGGSLSLTTTSTGALSGKVTLGVKSHSFSGRLDAVDGVNPTTTVLVSRGSGLPPVTLALEFDPGAQSFTGTVNDLPPNTPVALTAKRNPWLVSTNPALNNPATQWEGAYTALMEIDGALSGHVANPEYPQGHGWVTVALSKGGVVSAVARLADGTTVTSSTTLGPEGQIALHYGLYSTTQSATAGALHGWVNVTADSIGSQMNGGHPLLDGVVDWSKGAQAATSTTRSYKGGFGRHDLTVVGGRYVKPASNAIILGASNVAAGQYNMKVVFSEGGLHDATMTPSGLAGFEQGVRVTTANSIVMPFGSTANPGAVSMRLNAAAGSFSGSFRLLDSDPANASLPPLSRSVTYAGVLIPRLSRGGGHFQLQQLPEAGPPATTLSTSPIFSGRVEFQIVP